jgi:hypothetical protein
MLDNGTIQSRSKRHCDALCFLWNTSCIYLDRLNFVRFHRTFNCHQMSDTDFKILTSLLNDAKTLTLTLTSNTLLSFIIVIMHTKLYDQGVSSLIFVLPKSFFFIK